MLAGVLAAVTHLDVLAHLCPVGIARWLVRNRRIECVLLAVVVRIEAAGAFASNANSRLDAECARDGALLASLTAAFTRHGESIPGSHREGPLDGRPRDSLTAG